MFLCTESFTFGQIQQTLPHHIPNCKFSSLMYSPTFAFSGCLLEIWNIDLYPSSLVNGNLEIFIDLFDCYHGCIGEEMYRCMTRGPFAENGVLLNDHFLSKGWLILHSKKRMIVEMLTLLRQHAIPLESSKNMQPCLQGPTQLNLKENYLNKKCKNGRLLDWKLKWCKFGIIFTSHLYGMKMSFSILKSILNIRLSRFLDLAHFLENWERWVHNLNKMLTL